MTLTLAELAKQLGATLRGDADARVHRVAALDTAESGDVSFLLDSKYREYLAQTQATAVILSAQDAQDCSANALIVADPYLGYAKAAVALHPLAAVKPGIHSTATIGANAQLAASAMIGANTTLEDDVQVGDGARIGPGCVIGTGANIGTQTCLHANVAIGARITIGRNCVIHPGAVIGADGFGYAPEDGHWLKIPQLGSVEIGDNVEIGANTTIDRGALGDTVIEDGVKIDNLVQIAHNVRIGADTAIAGCAGISGSVEIGRRCKIGGSVGLAGHLQIADDVTITGMSLVTKSITEAGVYSGGWPSREARVWRRTVAALHRMTARKE